MKASIFKLLLSLVAVAALLITSCEGPEGPAGAQGPQGPAGDDGADGQGITDCLQCHNNSTDLKAKIMQYEESMHYMGGAYSYAGGRGGCTGCHAHEGYEQWETTAYGDWTAPDYPTKIACRTCHEIHETYTIDDYALKNAGAFNLQALFADNYEVDMGKGNQCGKCHQARPRTYNIAPGSDEQVEIGPHWGPHYGTQTNIAFGKGGYEIGEGYETNIHTHASGADGCVTCHVSEGNHNFEPELSACVACHSSAESFNHGDLQTEIAGLLSQLETHLVDAGVLEVEHEGEKGHPIEGITIPNAHAGAMYNYLMIYDDGSLGLHNPKYVRTLLQNSIAVFEQ